MPETTEAAEAAGTPGERKLSDAKILFPSREVDLSNGTRVVVEPWGLKKGALVLERLDLLAPKLVGVEANARQLLSRAWGEVVDLVSLTVDVPREEMEKPPGEGGWTFEDLLLATDAVLEVCVIRSDGSGALPLLVGLVARMGEMVTRSVEPATARRLLNDSARKGTSTAVSENGSGSAAETPKPV